MEKTNISRKKFIGILGGMGAAASADFYLRLVQIAQRDYGAEQDCDFPPMFIYNLPLIGFDETGFKDVAGVRNQLIAGIKKLGAAGSDFIVIPCNTVYYLYSDLQAASAVPIINIIEATVKAVKRAGYKKVGLLNSQSTRHYKLYESAFMRQGIETASAGDGEQKKVNEAILHVISGAQGQNDIRALQVIISRFKEAGAEAIILGCTELPLAITQGDCILPLFSSTNILAVAALDLAYKA